MEKLKAFFHDLGQFTRFSIEAFKYFPKNILKPREIFQNVFSIGVESLPVVLTTGLFMGLIFGLQLGNAMEAIIAGTAQYISGALSLSLIKEIGPVFTSLIVVSRVCSSVTAHLGTMKVTEQIDALKTFAVNPVDYLVTPRVLAGIISLPLLGFFSILVSLFGSWLMISALYDVPNSVFLEVAQIPLKTRFIYESVFKMAIIGAVLLLVSTYCGFQTKEGAAGVGKSVIRSVVVSSFLVIMLDYLLGAVFMLFSGGVLS
jgi:phospholipid/cholesterol/gamma-HCH transport system permease protein